MKPATRLAQIILDTPNWECNPALVAEVNRLRKQVSYGRQAHTPRAEIYRYKVYRDGCLVFEGTIREVAKKLKIKLQTVRNRAADGRVGQKGSAKGFRIERIDTRAVEMEGMK